MLEVRELRLVQAIEAHGSLARAARVLATSQPALTRSLAALEARLRGPLFERGPRGAIAMYQESRFASARPISLSVGRSGKSGERVEPIAARARMVPSAICCLTKPVLNTATSSRPASRSTIPGGRPR